MTNNNYIVRQPITNETQTLHRICLRKYNPTEPILDIEPTETDWQHDDAIVIPQDDLYAKAWDSNFSEVLSDKHIQPMSDDA